MEDKPREDLDKINIHVIGELDGTPVYFHEEQIESSVAVSFAPVEQDPNEGRIVIMSNLKMGTYEMDVVDGDGELMKTNLDASKYAIVPTGESHDTQTVCAKPTGDPTKPYYADNGEPYIPFHSKYKAAFIVTGVKEYDKFIEQHGDTTVIRINEKLDIYNGDNKDYHLSI